MTGLSIIDLAGQCVVVTLLSRPKVNHKDRTIEVNGYRCDQPVVAHVTPESCGTIGHMPIPVCEGHLKLATKTAKKLKVPLYP